MPLLFRNHICFVYLAHSRSPVITCGKNKWVSGFQFPQVREDVAGQVCYPREDIVPGLGRILTAILGLFVVPCCPGPQGTMQRVYHGSGHVTGPLTGYLLCCSSRGGGGSAFGKQAQVGKCPQDMGMCFLEAAGTWLPGRGMSAPSFWPGAGFICSRKGLVLHGAACERGGRGAQGCQPRAAGRLQGLGKDPCIGAGGLGRGLLEFRQTSAPPKLNA